MNLPRRIFLDTSVVNFIVDNSEYLFDNVAIPESINNRTCQDISAIAQIFYYANHNGIEMVISKTTFKEIEATTDENKRKKLIDYCSDLWEYFHELIGDDYLVPGVEVKYYEEYLIDKGLSFIDGLTDRRLIIEALFYKCDIFCTRDYYTI